MVNANLKNDNRSGAELFSSPNPFSNENAESYSAYYALKDTNLIDLGRDCEAPPQARFVHSQLRSLILDEQFSCLAGRSAFNRNYYRFGLYPKMNSVEATAALIHDLWWFVQEQESIADNFTTFVACFDGPSVTNDDQFESLVWTQLQRLNRSDIFDWDSTVSSDPADDSFSFSVCGRAFFVVGLSPVSERYIRRFAYPTLVFNAHYQFDRLRQENKLESLKKAIRLRETKLQGSLNPNLSDFGNDSEAKQYSGRRVEPSWKCPFHRQPVREVVAGDNLGIKE